MKIFVTGATGFVGANIARKLLMEGHEVHVLMRESSNSWRLGEVMSKLVCHKEDLSNVEGMRAVLKEVQPEIIIHTAVYGGLPNQTDTNAIVQTNIIGTKNLLEASKDIPYRLLINTGSSSEYGKKTAPMKENDVLEPTTEYGISKASATHYCAFFAKKYGKPIITLRLFSPYGSFEERNRLVSYCTLNILENKNIQIGNLNSARDFIFIGDVVDAYIFFMNNFDQKFSGEVFNIGSGEQHTVGDVLEKLFSVSGKILKVSSDESKQRVYDSSMWVADISKVRCLGWSPKYSFYEGMKKNFEWFQNNSEIYTKNEIAELENRAKEMKLEIAKILEKTYGSHIGGDYSVLDILNTLYFKIMNVDEKDPNKKNRDRLILSKGHNALALYSVLCKKGFFKKEYLLSYCQNGSCFEGHVNSHVPGVEVSTGSLGHGLAVGIGIAIANKNDKNPGRIFIILGDGECNEGSIWEAAILASRLKLDNLTVIVDSNKFQGIDSCEEVYGKNNLAKMWETFGFEVREIDGHNYSEIINTFSNIPFKEEKPSLVFANTIKGKGVSFMENKLEWHYKSPNKEQLKIIEEELK